VGLCADGTLLPPVLCTNDDNLSDTLLNGIEARVLVLPELGGPSGDTTQRWLGELDEYLEDEPYLFHDNGPEFISQKVQEDFQLKGIRDMPIPAPGGSVINPCDNSFIHDLKQRFYKKNRRTHADAIKAMFEAYYETTEESIQNYFGHCCLTGALPTRRYLGWLMKEGFRPSQQHWEFHEQCHTRYLAWKKNTHLLHKGIRPQGNPQQLEDCTLNGMYWHEWQVPATFDGEL
jgi:hypothetical protein